MFNHPANPCCGLGAALYEERVLYKTDNFFVAPTIGSIGIEGYLLIISQEHYEGVGDVPQEFYPELISLVTDVRSVLRQEYGTSALVFEHGPRVCGVRGGGCLDHAHLHVVPGVDVTSEWAADMMKRLQQANQFYRVDRTEGLHRIADIYTAGKSSYLFVESPEGVRLISEVNFEIPSQYFRRMIATQVKSPRWNWHVHPDQETLEQTVDKLKGKF